MQKVTQKIAAGELTRRKVRNLLHRIRAKKVFDAADKELAQGLQFIIEPQFREVSKGIKMDWENFTFIWDIHPEFPLQIVAAHEWVHAGGKYRAGKEQFCDPTAFTMQFL